MNIEFDVIDQLMIICSVFVRYWRKWKYNGRVHQLFIHFKEVLTPLGERYCTILPKYN